MLRLLTLTLAALALGAAPAAAFPLAPGNDDFADALPLGTATSAQHAGTTAGATEEVGEPYHWGRDRSVWYRWTPAKSGGTKVDVCGSGTDSVVAVYTGTAVDDLDVLTHAACLRSFVAQAGTTYRIAVVPDEDPDGGPFSLTLTQKTTTPDLKLAGPLVLTARAGSVPLAEVTGASGLQFAECTIDGKNDQSSACWPTPGKLRLDWQHLSHGPHTLKIAVRDGFGNVDPTPLVHTWTVDATPPDTAITTTQVSPLSDVAQASFTATEPGSTFACSAEGGAWGPCTAPHTFAFVGPGLGLRVRATDPFGNTDVTPAEWQWLRPPAPKPATPAPKPSAPAPAPKPSAPVPAPRPSAPVPAPPAPLGGPVPAPPAGRPSACRPVLAAPRTVTRRALRRGVAVAVAVPRRCAVTVQVRHRGRILTTWRGRPATGRVSIRLTARTVAGLPRGAKLTLRAGTSVETVRLAH